MPTAVLRALIIGTGFGAKVVDGVYRELGIAVDIVSSRDVAAVRAAVRRPADFVSVHSPPFLHAEHVAAALAEGRHVVCDKPFGRTAAEARAMLDGAQAAGVLHFVNFEFRHDPGRAELRELLHEGAIGDLRHIHWFAHNAGSRQPLRRHGWLFDRSQTGGWIGAFGSHAIDTIRVLGGEIASVGGVSRTDISERPDRAGDAQPSTAEDAFAATFRLESGATATLDTAFAAPVTLPQRITVIGSEGVAELVGSIELTLRRPGEKPRTTFFEPSAGDPHLPAMRPWAALLRDAILERRQIAPSFADGVACAVVMDQLRAAMR
jgi:predicted dehydrogenase